MRGSGFDQRRNQNAPTNAPRERSPRRKANLIVKKRRAENSEGMNQSLLTRQVSVGAKAVRIGLEKRCEKRCDTWWYGHTSVGDSPSHPRTPKPCR